MSDVGRAESAPGIDPRRDGEEAESALPTPPVPVPMPVSTLLAAGAAAHAVCTPPKPPVEAREPSPDRRDAL
jgi:hypothetical protein